MYDRNITYKFTLYYYLLLLHHESIHTTREEENLPDTWFGFFFLRDFSNKFEINYFIRFNLNHNQSCNLNEDKLEIDIQSFEFRAVLFLFEKCIDIPCCCDWNLDTSLHVSSHYNSLQHIIFSCFYLHSVRHLVMNIFFFYTEWD